MKMLLLAPQPFYQLRGTPIAVKRFAEACSRKGWRVDILAFHEGASVDIPDVRVFRIPRIPWTRGMHPGFSLKKLACDVALLFSTVRRLRKERYDLVQAGEESVFIAMLCRWMGGPPYVYDMDSCISDQISGSHPILKPILPLVESLEGISIRGAIAVLAVCDALAAYAKSHGGRNITVLPDAPLCAPPAGRAAAERKEGAATAFMYIGNLEEYQGIDLLIEAFTLLARSDSRSTLDIIGGAREHIAKYAGICGEKGIAERVRFRGEQPPERLGEFMSEADVLVSPRTKGKNTPMKIYSYLQAGKPILATDIPSHTQALSPDFACLTPPEPDAMARAMGRLASDPALRAEIGERALRVARARFTPEAFDRTAFAFCDLVEGLLANGRRAEAAPSLRPC